MSAASDRSLQRRYIRAARVVTVSARGVIEDGAVAVEGSRITAVGPAAEVTRGASPGAVEAYADATLMPGLVDAHAHLTLAADRRTYEQMVLDPDEMMALVSVSNLQRHLACGVTTLRDNGGRNRVTFIVREAINRGYFIGPRLLLSGRPVTHRYGHFYWCNGVADGIEAIRATVRQLVAEGADHIKIMASGGATAGNIPYYASYGVDELRAAVDTAHGLGRLTTAHCRAKQSMINALEAGLDCIEHGEFLIPGKVVQYGGGISSSGIMEYDPAVARPLPSGSPSRARSSATRSRPAATTRWSNCARRPTTSASRPWRQRDGTPSSPITTRSWRSSAVSWATACTRTWW